MNAQVIRLMKINTADDKKVKKQEINIFRSREKSRFSFVEDKKESAPIQVPEFINKFFHTKFSGHSFFKKFSTDYNLDLICLDTKLEPNNTWTEFLLSHKKI